MLLISGLRCNIFLLLFDDVDLSTDRGQALLVESDTSSLVDILGIVTGRLEFLELVLDWTKFCLANFFVHALVAARLFLRRRVLDLWLRHRL